jgi:hypothetical protein
MSESREVDPIRRAMFRLPLELDGEVTIKLSSLYMGYTYEGLLEGYPNEEGNRFFLESIERETDRIHGKDLPRHLIQPTFTTSRYPDHFRGEEKTAIWMPPIYCISRFDEHLFFREHDEEFDGYDFRSLIVTWFQEHSPYIITPEAVAEIRKIPWAEKAVKLCV